MGNKPEGNNFRHGMAGTPEHHTWKNIRQRCQNSKHSSYKYYGAVGIKVCKRWSVFENFYADMGPRPKNHSIDRIDPFGDYAPNNCRWANDFEQACNKRNTPKYNGKTMKQLAAESGLNWKTIWGRFKRGDKDILRPRYAYKKRGHRKGSLAEKCAQLGVSYGTVLARRRLGWSLERALSTPIRAKNPNGAGRHSRVKSLNGKPSLG